MSNARKPNRIKWYRSPVPREQLSRLNQRSDFKGLLQTGGYLGLLLITGTGCVLAMLYAHWAIAIAVVLFHGTCYAFTINAFHELVHDSVFRTRWMNRFFLRIVSFLGVWNHHFFWASHTEHHKYTLHPPDDLEVVLPMKLKVRDFLLHWAIISPLPLWWRWRGVVNTARGKLGGEWGQYLFTQVKPESRQALHRWAWILIVGHIAIVALAILTGWWWLIVVITLAPFYGGWLQYLCNNTQHAGLVDNTNDFRLCCRTIYLNPFVQFLYWHMNYHTEHHMYAAVPCYNLGKLHGLIRDDLPSCPRGLWQTWRQIITIFQRQKEDPEYQFAAPLPVSAEAPLNHA